MNVSDMNSKLDGPLDLGTERAVAEIRKANVAKYRIKIRHRSLNISLELQIK